MNKSPKKSNILVNLEGVPFPQIEHILSLEADCSPSTSFSGWGFDICDRYRLRALKNVFKSVKGKLLDYGCGAKPYQPILNSDNITDWMGVDMKTRTSGPGQTNKADIYFQENKIPCDPEAFDAVLATQVFEHVPDLDVSLDDICRALRPGGLLIATVPLTSSLHEVPHDYRRLTPYGMQREAAKAGMTLTRVIALGGPICTGFTFLATNINPIAGTPLIGKVFHEIAVKILTTIGRYLELFAYKAGLRQTHITYDYLYILEKKQP